MARFCKECGSALADGAKFCTNCGAAVEPATAADPAPVVVTPIVERPAVEPVGSVSATAVPAPAPEPVPVMASAPAPAPAPAQTPAQSYVPEFESPKRNNTPLLIGGGAGLIALAGLAAYFILSKPEPAALDPNASATATAKAPTPAAGTEPLVTGGPEIAPGVPASQLPPGQMAPVGPNAVPGTAPAGATSGAAVGGSVLKYASGVANIRDIATAEAPSRVVGSLKRGASVQGVMHVGLSGGTYWFKLADGRGYVSAANLVDAPPPAVAAAPKVVQAPAAASGPLCSVVDRTGSNLRVRSGPNGGIIGGLPNGVQLRWLSEATDGNGALWYRVDPVQSGYPTGWVFADHVVC
jgi:hypothetical protein